MIEQENFIELKINGKNIALKQIEYSFFDVYIEQYEHPILKTNPEIKHTNEELIKLMDYGFYESIKPYNLFDDEDFGERVYWRETDNMLCLRCSSIQINNKFYYYKIIK